MKGYAGQILRVNLTQEESHQIPLAEDKTKKFLGGTGLAAKFLYDETDAHTDPLGPENLLVFMSGPFAGTSVPTSCRHQIVSVSPLTGIFGESDVGGSWAHQLKRAGFDGIIIQGKSKRPVYLWITNGKVEIRGASHIWGKDTYEVDSILREETHEKATVASIGPAGEKMVRLASIVHDGTDARIAGRCGLGAVMGSKNLKAIVALGKGKIEVDAPDKLRDSAREMNSSLQKNMESMTKYGTSRRIVPSELIGDTPLENWKHVPYRWEQGAQNISGPRMAETILTGSYHCRGCVIGCGRRVRITTGPYAGVEGGGPEYETLAMLGGSLLVDNLEAIAMANELCNRYGIDTISTGAVIAFAMEAYEKGIITRQDAGGLDLSWGKGDALVEMVRMIGEARGIGALLGQGVRKAAEEIGHNSVEFALHVKGLEMPAHDPRAFNGLAVMYATSSRGAHHTSGQTHVYESRLSMPEINHTPPGPLVVEGKGILAAKTQNIMNLFDSLKLCKFSQFGGVRLTHLKNWYTYVTGNETTVQEMLTTGERIFNLKRLINNRLGISRKDDTLPARLLTLRRRAEGMSPNLPPLGEMLAEYYEHRKWTEDGIPSSQILEKLGL